eukprot:Polyplicarium_translucidae@DN3369_c0_g1_i28.p2
MFGGGHRVTDSNRRSRCVVACTEMTKKRCLLFDVDGTLSPSRLAVPDRVVQFLKAIKDDVTVALVSGSDMGKVAEQFGDFASAATVRLHVFRERDRGLRQWRSENRRSVDDREAGRRIVAARHQLGATLHEWYRSAEKKRRIRGEGQRVNGGVEMSAAFMARRVDPRPTARRGRGVRSCRCCNYFMCIRRASA